MRVPLLRAKQGRSGPATIFIIAATLEIAKKEIERHDPEISETNLQIGQKLKLPLRSNTESKTPSVITVIDKGDFLLFTCLISAD